MSKPRGQIVSLVTPETEPFSLNYGTEDAPDWRTFHIRPQADLSSREHKLVESHFKGIAEYDELLADEVTSADDVQFENDMEKAVRIMVSDMSESDWDPLPFNAQRQILSLVMAKFMEGNLETNAPIMDLMERQTAKQEKRRGRGRNRRI